MGAKGEVKREKIVTPEVEYRKIEALNYSSIVTFDKSPVKFYEEFILGLPKEDEDTSASLLGNLIDDILLTAKGDTTEFEQIFSDRYALLTGEPSSSAQGFMLADELFKITKRTIIDGEITEEFEPRFREAFDNVQRAGKYKGKTVEWAIEDFNTKNKTGMSPAEYFKSKIDNIGKLVVSEGLKLRALEISSYLLQDDFTKSLLDLTNEVEGIEKLPKFPIDFIYKGENGSIKGKCEVDLLIVDHNKKSVFPYDLKSTYDNTIFPFNYIKKKYYIQAGWYSIGVTSFMMNNGLKDYKLEPYQFISADTSKNNRRPLIYRLNEQHLNDAWEGFSINSSKFRGIKELVDNIIWANESKVWNISKTAYEQNGIIALENYN